MSDFIIENGILKRYTGVESNVNIPEGVTQISNYAFYLHSDLQSVIIPEGVTKIGESTFAYCEKLQSVTLPQSMTEIESDAFCGCRNLQSIEIPDGVIKIGKNVFDRCEALQSVTLPCGITQIEYSMFYGCKSLQCIVIPESVKEIGFNAFKHCSSLKNVIFPNGLRYIGDGAFWGCSGLQNITIPDGEVELAQSVFADCKNLESVTIGKGVTAIPNDAFMGCEKLHTVFGGEDLQKVSKTAFSRCPLKTDERGFAIIKNILFRYEGEHEHLEIPEEVTEIADEVFCDLPNLVSVVFPAHIKKLGNNFKNCPKLKCAHPNADVLIKGLPKKTVISNPEALRNVLSDYIWLSYRYRTFILGDMSTVEMISVPDEPIVPAVPENFGEIVDLAALRTVLEKQRKTSGDYRLYAFAYARFASEESIEACVADIRKNKKGQARMRYWAENMTEALYYSDTKAAREYIEKNADFEKYASMRGFSAQEYRDRESLPDFGFDANGVKRYSVDGKTLEVRITSRMELALTDAQKGKAVRSISKKTEEGAAAAADYALLKKEIKEFFKKRIEYIKKIYITGEKISTDIWWDIYLANPLFRSITESLLWEDETKTVFAVCGGKPVDVNGKDYTPIGKMQIAHILDMTEEDIVAWREFLTRAQRSLLIEQVWEPLADTQTSDIQARYQGVTLTKQERNELKKRLKTKGIEVKSESLDKEFDPSSWGYEFSTEGTMCVGKKLRLEYEIVDQDTGLTELKNFVSGLNEIGKRERNTVLFEFDRAAVRSHIENNQPQNLTESALSSFTLPQILEFSDLSAQLGMTECTAVLLDYKNRTFGETDIFDMFLLDF